MNKINKVKVKLGRESHQYEIEIGHNLLKSCGEWAQNLSYRK